MNVSEYDFCDLHETTFLQGDVCPVCEDNMWQYARDMTEFNYLANTQLIYENTIVINGDVYLVSLEELPDGELFGELIRVPDGCQVPGIPF